MEFKVLITPILQLCWLSVFFCGTANASPPAVTSVINDITAVMDEAENLGSWPNGYCKKVYSSISDKSKNAVDVVMKLPGDKELADNLHQLNEQAKGMLDLCEPFEKNTFPGGQLQTRYLRADMSLWKAQFSMLLNEKQTPIEKVKISRAEGISPPEKLDDFDVFKDCNESYCREMVVLPEGNYMMGG